MLSLTLHPDSIKSLIEHAAASIDLNLTEFTWIPPDGNYFWGFKYPNKNKRRASHFFNPLTSRSTALEVALRLNFCCKSSSTMCKVYYNASGFRLYQPRVVVSIRGDTIQDKSDAMCEAITRAAALISCRKLHSGKQCNSLE